jgi:hypothetical protein
MPEDVVQTLSTRTLSKEQLETLREKHNFKLDEQLKPREEFALLDSV